MSYLRLDSTKAQLIFDSFAKCTVLELINIRLEFKMIQAQIWLELEKILQTKHELSKTQFGLVHLQP